MAKQKLLPLKVTTLPEPVRQPRETELLAIHAVRNVAHRANVSPALALAIAELSGLLREVRHG